MASESLKIAQVNICSLCPKANELKSVIGKEHIAILGLKIIGGILYRPPNYKKLHASINMIDSYLQEIRPKCDEVILLDDLNINLIILTKCRMTYWKRTISLKLLLTLLGKPVYSI
nr:unnamed protein product [Callosobruchus analis]